MKRLLLAMAALCLAATANAVMDVPSQGWDGALNITANTTIDLSQAITGTWDTQPAGYVAGKGIYDPEKWAIVFHYTSVTVAAGVTLSFTNHPANPPVVWLVEGAAQINGTVKVAGAEAGYTGDTNGGPGGFRGGRSGIAIAPPGGGFGPGGGNAGTLSYPYASSAGYAIAGLGHGSLPGGYSYGNAAIVPLIGGSGGGGRFDGQGSGGGGGGAILIAAQASLIINGAINANGGHGTGGGSGGAIRLVTSSIAGSGQLTATASGYSTPGYGRIRIEANTQNLAGLNIQPAASIVDPGEAPQFWQDSATPAVRVVSINGINVAPDPRGSLVYPHQDISLSGAGDVTVVLEAMNVPTNGTIQVFIVKQGGARTQLPTSSVTLIGGNTALSTWQATFPAVTNGMYAVQARAVLP